MVEYKLVPTFIRNWGPRFVASAYLVTPPDMSCGRILINCPPEWVDHVEVKIRNMLVVDVDSWTDEEGQRHTAGQRLAALNGYAGLHITGAEFSVLLSDLPLGGLVFRSEDGPYLFLHLNELAKVDHLMRVDLVCHGLKR